MSWFDENQYGPLLRSYQEKSSDKFEVKHGVNNHRDHSGMLSTDLSENERLVDEAIRIILDQLPGKEFSYPKGIQVKFVSQISSYCNTKHSKIGKRINAVVSQGGQDKEYPCYFQIGNLGNRGEPKAVYTDATSRFLFFMDESTTYTQYGFHKFLNAKYTKLERDYQLLGLKKQLKESILFTLKESFNFDIVSNKYIILPEVELNTSSTHEQLIKMVRDLLIIGLVKESYRSRNILLSL
ncbi:hypothetical protein [Halalkalibacter alkaliphilus]|uniref:Uncharacterized protein n=1 Tax=Halalkalibacter alkaliphilus TaxID=2917993 RepID=A0A9X2CVY0_9BACI|nr:hypothetical protein [Halalkalibacter alkaliphilus]MCL7749206.1 hypothetical protein [Halalkalibacter alkaliphilus]